MRFIENVTHINDTSIIKVSPALEYIKTANLLNKINVLTYKKYGKRGDSYEKFILSDVVGLQVGQEVYIHNALDENHSVLTKITLVISSSNTIYVQTPLTDLPIDTDLVLISGQMSLVMSKRGSQSYNVHSDNSRGFFQGQMVEYSSENIEIAYTNLTKKKGTYVYTNFIDDPSPQAIIKSLSYGEYYTKFGGTSAAAPIVSGIAALVLSANSQLNAVEIKHILKISASKIVNVESYKLQSDILKYDYGYEKNVNYGTGRVNAEDAIKLALNWHTDSLLSKPKMRFSKLPNIPDIWISDKKNVIPESSNTYNSLNTSQDQNISIRLRNEGNRYSFQETDLRVLVALTTETNPKFPFPTCWYQNTESATVKTFLLDVKEVIPIAPNSESIVKIEWKQLSKFWNDNKLGDLNGFRVYLLAHIAPFDGIDTELSREDASLNKNLLFREIFVTQTSNNAKGTSGEKVSISHQENNYNLVVKDGLTNEKFSFDNINIKQIELDVMEFRFSLVNRKSGQVEQSIIFEKNGDSWEMDKTPTSNWLSVNIDIQNSELYGAEYKNAVLNYEFNYDNTDKEINFNVTQA